ncbi:MAG: CBS domain-containing protein [Alphaproteobacteria bacterium]
MTVAKAVAEKKGAVQTVKPDATIAETATILAGANIGAVVVSQDGSKIDGIISERDIVRGLASDGPGVMDWPVRQLMTADVITCAAADTLGKVMAVMTAKRIRHLPICDGDGGLTGILSIGDVVKQRLADVQAEADAMRSYITQG